MLVAFLAMFYHNFEGSEFRQTLIAIEIPAALFTVIFKKLFDI
jgi:hypothetical protein